MRRGVGRLLGTVLAVTVVHLASCSDSSSDAQTGGAGGGSADAGPSYGPSPCASCVTAACGAAENVCAADPGCAAHLDCVRACPLAASGDADLACVAACPAPSTPNGQAALTDWAECRSNAACTACGAITDAGTDGKPNQNCAPADAGTECSKCKQEKCCDTEACWDSTVCIDFIDCVDACSTKGQYESCYQACLVSNAAGAEAGLAWQACAVPQCALDCVNVTDTCLTCWLEKCADTMEACWADAECYAIELCVTDCPNDACSPGCVAGRSEHAVDLWNQNGACINANCIAACQ